jgi:hypothetical protein
MSTPSYEIPLIPSPQEFQISLNNVSYQVRIIWNWVMQTWVMDMYDVQGNAVLLGNPLVTGANLWEQFTYLGFPGRLEVQSDQDTLAPPTFSNLGLNSHLYYLPKEPPA